VFRFELSPKITERCVAVSFGSIDTQMKIGCQYGNSQQKTHISADSGMARLSACNAQAGQLNTGGLFKNGHLWDKQDRRYGLRRKADRCLGMKGIQWSWDMGKARSCC